MTIDWSDAERKLTDRVTVLEGTRQGAYPSGNSVLVQGSSETFLIDPSIDVIARGGAPRPIDAVLNSHAHEDHMTGNGFFADARIHIHEADLPGATSLDGFMNIYGFADPEQRAAYEKTFVESSTTHRAPTPRDFQTVTVSTSAGSRSKPSISPVIPAAIVASESKAMSSFSRTST